MKPRTDDLCNRPGTVYAGSRDGWRWYDYNGDAPVDITADEAVDYLRTNDIDGPWTLHEVSALSQAQYDEMRQAGYKY